MLKITEQPAIKGGYLYEPRFVNRFYYVIIFVRLR